MVSRTMADGSQGLAVADDSGTDTQAAGALVRHPAPGQGLTAAATAEALERDPHIIGHLRQAQEGVGLRRGRTCGPDIRADRRFPPRP